MGRPGDKIDSGSVRSGLVLAGILLVLLAMFSPASQGGELAGVSIPVPRDAIYPGGAITDEQLVDKAFRTGVTRLAVHQTREGVVGKVARRVLLPGQPIPLSVLQEAELVTPGQLVTVLYTSEGLEITSRAMPLQPGKLGDVVSCRNVNSGAVFRARVESAGVVRVGGE